MAVAGIYGAPSAARLVYLCLYALQHRGQEGSGIASTDGKTIYSHKYPGLVSDAYKEHVFAYLEGSIAIGNNSKHNTDKNNSKRDLQPLVAELPIGQLAISCSGLLLTDDYRKNLIKDGEIFTTYIGGEVMLRTIARKCLSMKIEDAILETFREIKGAYAVLIMSANRMFAFRDPNGFKPLILGEIKGTHVLVSETAALDLLGADFVREIEPGELVVITDKGVESYAKIHGQRLSQCIFEYVYTARPDSFMFSLSVYEVRKEWGRRLALQNNVKADIVIPVPDSGIAAAIGYAQQAGLPFEMGIVRNHYVGRTFIQPSQDIRNFNVKVKLNPVDNVLKGKKLIVVDDSIVRGTTCMQIVQMLKEAGAAEVHVRIASPQVQHLCRYGTGTPGENNLLANKYSLEEIRRFITADSLDYLSMNNMLEAIGQNCYCTACFSGDYPLI
jgi:amidophosphoribosyltransferase